MLIKTLEIDTEIVNLSDPALYVAWTKYQACRAAMKKAQSIKKWPPGVHCSNGHIQKIFYSTSTYHRHDRCFPKVEEHHPEMEEWLGCPVTSEAYDLKVWGAPLKSSTRYKYSDLVRFVQNGGTLKTKAVTAAAQPKPLKKSLLRASPNKRITMQSRKR